MDTVVVGRVDDTLSSADQSTVMITMVTAIGMSTTTVVMGDGDLMIGECRGRNGWDVGGWEYNGISFEIQV